MMENCWVSIIVLLGFVEYVISTQVGNSTSSTTSSADIAQSLTKLATNIPSIKTVSATLYGITIVNTSIQALIISTSKYMYTNVNEKLTVGSSTLLTVSGTSSRKVILTTVESTSSTSFDVFIGSTSHPSISSTSTFTNIIDSQHTSVVVSMPLSTSTSGSITGTQSNLALSVLKSSSQEIKESQNKTSIISVIKSSPYISSSNTISSAKNDIRTTPATTLVQITSSLNTKNISVAQVMTPLSSTTGIWELITSTYYKTSDVEQISSSINNISSKYSPITIFTSIMVSESVVGINRTIKKSAKTVHVSPITSIKRSVSSTILSTAIITARKSGESSFLTSSSNVLQLSKLSLFATNSFEKSMPATISEIISTSSTMLNTKSSSVAMSTSFPIVNVTHTSDTKIIEYISSSSYLSSSRSSAVDFTTIVPVVVESVTSTVLSSMLSNIHFSTSSSFSKKTQPVISSDVKSSPSSTPVSPKLSNIVLSSTMAVFISSSMLTSSIAAGSPITSSLSLPKPIDVTPSSSIHNWPKTTVVVPHFIPVSSETQFTLAGRVGIGVAIAAGIIIIVLLIYFAKSKRKINRYRRYDNTYQIPGFTDIGGMVQLSTIGDSEYEILDATDYTRGDNPLYDLTQNSGPETSYVNNGYTKNGHGDNIATTNTNATNITNFSTFK